MKAVVLSFTQAGTALGCRVAACLRGGGWDVRQASLKKFAVVQEGVLPFTPNLHDEAARAFEAARLVVFVGAAGIAVRTAIKTWTRPSWSSTRRASSSSPSCPVISAAPMPSPAVWLQNWKVRPS